MRSLLLIPLMIGAFLSAQAQISRGAMLWSGGLQLDSQTGPGTLGFTLSPEAHYFFSDHFTIGGRFTLGSTFEKGVQLLVVDPQIRYYFNSQRPNSNFFAFLHPEFFFPIDEEFGQENRVRLFLGGGWQLRLTPNVALETKLSAIYNNRALQSAGSSFFSNTSYQLESGLLLFLNAYEESPFSPQIGKGSWMVGGSNLQANFQSNEMFRQFNLSITPRIAYFLSDQLLAGLGLPFAYNLTAMESGSFFDRRLYSQITGFAPFFRYYPGQWSPRVFPYLEVEGTYLLSRIHDRTSPFAEEIPRHRYYLNISGGINYFLTPTVALETAAFFNYDTHMDDTRLGIQLGFQFYLSHKRD